MYFEEKPKRKRKNSRWGRIFLVLLLGLPTIFIFNPYVDTGWFGHTIAIVVLIYAAMYLTYQAIGWLIYTIYGSESQEVDDTF